MTTLFQCVRTHLSTWAISGGLALYLGTASQLWADPVWQGPAGTIAIPGTEADWAVNANWTDSVNPATHVKPTATTTARINNGGTAGITSSEFAKGLFLGDSAIQSGNLHITSKTVGMVTNTGSLVVAGDYALIGDFGTGRVTVDGGGDLTTQKTYLGTDAGGAGYVTVSGAGSTWTITDNTTEFQVGSSGHGEVLIQQGATVTANDLYMGFDSTTTATGSLTVDGSGSSYNGGGLYAGYQTGNVGDVYVSNTALLKLTGQIYLGLFGNGHLQVSSGGVVQSKDAFVAGAVNTANSSALVTGANSLWTITGGLNVGTAGIGTLNVEAGGKVTSTTASTIGNGSGNGHMIVTGGNSSWVNSNVLNVGSGSSTGVLDILNGGLVSNTNAFIGKGATGKGTVNVGGVNATTTVASTWTVTGNLIVGASDQFSGATGGWGAINVSNGGIVNMQNGIYMASATTKTSTLTVDGAGSLLNYAPGNGDPFYVGSNATSTIVIDVTNGGHITGPDSVTTGPSNATNTTYSELHLAQVTGSTATVNVNGTGSSWYSGQFVEVGSKGNGTLNVLAGGAFTAGQLDIGYHGGSTGYVTVSGANSKIVIGTTNPQPTTTVGTGGTGTLDVLDGGLLQTYNLRVGDHLVLTGGVSEDSFGTGSVKISGTNSRVETQGEVAVAWGANGSLLIEKGGVLDANGTGVQKGIVFIGYDQTHTGSAIVRDTGSRLDAENDLTVGGNGTGTLDVSLGGQITSQDGWVGQFSNAAYTLPPNVINGHGTVTMTDEGTKWTLSGQLFLGNQGIGDLNLKNGADIAVGSDFILGSDFSATGTANISDSGTLLTAATMKIGGTTSMFGTGTGSVNLVKGGEVNISGGTSIRTLGALHIGIGGLAGKLTSASVQNDGLLEFNHTDNYVYNIATSGNASGKLVKKGSGRVDVGGNNTFSGSVSIEDGTLRATNANALGNTTGGTVVKDGASLEMAGGVAIGAEALQINGLGDGGGGALRSVNGNNSFGGVITVSINSAITVLADSLGIAGDINLASSKLTLDATGNLVLQGNISGDGDLEKTGTGKVTITSTTAYTGEFTVTGGELALNGSLADGSRIEVANNAVLSGSGTAQDITLLGGSVLRPGQSPGTLHGEDLFWTAGSVLEYELGDSASQANSDLLALEGDLTKEGSGAYLFKFSDGTGLPTLGDTYTLITFGLNNGFQQSDFSWIYTGSESSFTGQFILEEGALKFTLVPEPGVTGLLLLSSLSLLLRRHRRRVAVRHGDA